MTARSRGRRPRRRTPAALVGVAVLLAATAAAWWWAVRPSPVEVYFVRSDAAHRKESLALVHRPAPRGTGEVRLGAALRALLDGPGPREGATERDVRTEIPAGTRLLGVHVSEGLVTVNLSSAYAAGGGSTSMLARVWQVVYTATQLPQAPAAQIVIDGRRVEALGGEGVMIGAPLRRPASPPSF